MATFMLLFVFLSFFLPFNLFFFIYISFLFKKTSFLFLLFFLHLYCSAQLSMSNNEKCYRNEIITIIIIK